jgi:mono/diheme cytochrome c family protein
MPIVRLAALLMLAVVTTAAEPRAFLEKHCFECHDPETKKGGLDLTKLGAEKSNPAKWTQIHDAVAAGEMPPAKRKERPSAGETSVFLQELDATLTQLSADARRPASSSVG